MGRCRFVSPNVTRIQLTDGDWIEVKDTLSIGEVRHLTRLTTGEGPNGEKRARLPIGFAQTLVCLVDWNLTDQNEKTVPISEEPTRMAALDALSQDDFMEIEAAVDKHMKVSLMAAAKKKKTKAGSNPSSST
jgi:hypothetical protein